MQEPARARFEHLELGGGRVHDEAGTLRLAIPALGRGYADAQLDDYRRLPRGRFPWRPPLHLRLRARSSHAVPTGTLGFGFWNDPLSVSFGQGGTAGRLPAVPSALWFFHGSPPHDLALQEGVPGVGWRAASLHSRGLPWALVALGAPLALGLSHFAATRPWAVRSVCRTVRAQEVVVSERLNAWHTYEIAWHPCEASFQVDGRTVLIAPNPPPGPLGFVAWIDNQYAILSPERGIRFGVLPCSERQWLEITDLDIRLL
jgi:hypothetical protein